MNAVIEKFRDQLAELWSRIQETSVYMNMREKYEALNPRAQKALIAGIFVVAGLFLFSFPYSYLSSSQDSLGTFEENRGLIRELLKASSTLREPSPLPPEIQTQDLVSTISHSLEEFHLVAEQTSAPVPINEKVTNLVPDQVKQTGVSLSLKKLNLKQVVEISHRLQTLNPATKVVGMDVHENATSHYFDVTYRIASFSIPPSDDGGAPGKGGGKGKSGSKAAPKGEAKDEG